MQRAHCVAGSGFLSRWMNACGRWLDVSMTRSTRPVASRWSMFVCRLECDNLALKVSVARVFDRVYSCRFPFLRCCHVELWLCALCYSADFEPCAEVFVLGLFRS